MPGFKQRAMCIKFKKIKRASVKGLETSINSEANMNILTCVTTNINYVLGVGVEVGRENERKRVLENTHTKLKRLKINSTCIN